MSTSITRTQKTYCRICEAHCGLEIEVEGDQIKAVRPDKTHPVSQGYVCIKGTSIGDIHHDPDRVNFPLKKVKGQWERISWQQAIREIGDKTKAIRSKHGNRAVGHYFGNPSNFSFQNILYSASFMQALGSPNAFASHSIDLNNKFRVAEEMYGAIHLNPVPDLQHTEFFMCLGSNPAVSQMSVFCVTNAVEKLQAITDRGGQVIIVDPRRSETAKKVGEHLFIKPGADAWLLMGMMHVLVYELNAGKNVNTDQVTGLDEFMAIAKEWTPERVAPLTGISGEKIRKLTHSYAKADGAALYMSTGVNMGPFGSICYWLIQGISLITENLDVRGGLVFPQGPYDLTRIVHFIEGKPENRPRTLERGWQPLAAAFPVAALEEEITVDHPERIRALFVSAGNPVHSVPGNTFEKTFEQLDLLVAIDIYLSETAQCADYVLPATDMLERSDFPLSHQSLQAVPHAQFTEAVVEPKYERREEWQIFTALARASGAGNFGASVINFLPPLNKMLSVLPGLKSIQPDDVLAFFLRIGGKVSLKELRENPQGVSLQAAQPGSFLGKRVARSGKKVQLAPPSLLQDLNRLEKAAEDVAPDEGLQIIGRRERRSHNSWMHNNRRIKHDGGNEALLHPDDAAAIGVSNGDMICIGSGERTVKLPVQITDDVMPGVLCVPHGWGHRKSGLTKARDLPGANINRVLPNAAEHMEPVSGQAIMLGHRLKVTAAG